jgi:hypothetical protein
MQNICEIAKFVQVQEPKDKTGAAATTEWISMKKAKWVNFIINTGTMTSTSNQAVTLYVADDASGTHNAAIGANADLTMPYVWKRTVSTDTLVKTAVASSTFNLTKSSDNKTFIIPVDTDKAGTFTASSVTYNAQYVRINVATPGAHACLMNVQAILTGLRYAEDSPPSAIT